MTLLTRLATCLALSVLLIASVWAKGVTVKIVVSGNDFSEPLSITDQSIVGQFSIWSGPNSKWRAKDGPWNTDYSGIFIDFPNGVIDSLPSSLVQFEIEFFIAGTPTDEPADQTYKIRYAINPTEPGGYMYLPTGNPFVYHGVEGNWFRSTSSWEELVRPAIQSKL